MSSSEFISEGWSRVGGSEPNGVERLAVDQVKLVPAPEVRHGWGGDPRVMDRVLSNAVNST